MAGIGFELRKAISRGGIGSFVKVAFSGIMIVAGPWLLSIIGITAIQRFMAFSVREAPDHFIGVIIYSYAWSLVFFGGVHFVYTRLMADLLFVRKSREAAGALLFFMLCIGAMTAVGGTVSMIWFEAPVEYPVLFRIGAIVLFVSINLIWLLMIFISLLKWYTRILLIYVTGMIVSLLLVYLLGDAFGSAGAIAGYSAGQLSIAVLLTALSFLAHRPRHVWRSAAQFVSYAKRFTPLLATGVLYSWGIWVDKIVYWYARGESVPGTFMRLFDGFDITVYLANLSMIPGMVFFIIGSETSFYLLLRSFLISLGRGTYAEIQRRKTMLSRGLRRSVIDLATFQGVVTMILVALAPVIAGAFGIDPGVLRIVLMAVFAHLLFLTLMNFGFYLEFFRVVLLGSTLFFVVNLGIAILSVSGFDVIPPGASYLCAGVAGSIALAGPLMRSRRKIDRIILARVSGL